MKLSKNGKLGAVLTNDKKEKPSVSILSALVGLEENKIDTGKFTGKKLLLVNTASDCGYTGQFAELQKLQDEYKNTLVILGFPSNDFKEQDSLDNKAIQSFCQVNYGVTFPILKKSQVINGDGQNAVFSWLSHSDKNGWNSQQPAWNFSKYLVNENGNLEAYFGPAVSPLAKELKQHLD